MCYCFLVAPRNRKPKKRITSNSDQMLDAGGGGLTPFMGGPNSMDYGLQRSDFRSQSGLGWDAPDPIQRPREKIRVVQLPGTVIYVPVPQRPKKKRGKGGGGASTSSAQ